MKAFFKTILASTIGVIVGLTFMGIIGLLALVGLVAGLTSTPTYVPSNNTVLRIDLNGTIADNPAEDPLALLWKEDETTLSLKEILKAIKVAGEDPRINGIYLRAGNLDGGSASLQSIRRALETFKESGKFVVAYGDNYTQGCYYLCSVADRLFLNPQGMVMLNGLSSQTLFFTGLMEKLGVEMEVFKVGSYKGAVEPFLLKKLSDENREQIQSYISTIWGHLVEGIASSRRMSTDAVEQFANEGLAFAGAQKAIDMGLIDEQKYQPEVDRFIREQTGQENKQSYASVSEVASLDTPKGSGPKIALLYAEGEIVPRQSVSGYDLSQVITERLADQLIELKEDKEIKAVVLRINSPGGSFQVADQIWRQVEELKKEKPIVISMGDAAASGGYYIACAANRIIAEPNTLTGSIGVFSLLPNTTRLADKLGIGSDVVKTNPYADLGNSMRPMSADERALLQHQTEYAYRTFLSRCADGRSMTTEQVDRVAQGRVWTGSQAVDLGLVDDLGGLQQAISDAAELAKLDHYQIKEITTNKSLFEELFATTGPTIKANLLRSFLGDDFIYYQTLQQIRVSSGIQARLPYDIRPL